MRLCLRYQYIHFIYIIYNYLQVFNKVFNFIFLFKLFHRQAIMKRFLTKLFVKNEDNTESQVLKHSICFFILILSRQMENYA